MDLRLVRNKNNISQFNSCSPSCCPHLDSQHSPNSNRSINVIQISSSKSFPSEMPIFKVCIHFRMFCTLFKDYKRYFLLRVCLFVLFSFAFFLKWFFFFFFLIYTPAETWAISTIMFVIFFFFRSCNFFSIKMVSNGVHFSMVANIVYE